MLVIDTLSSKTICRMLGGAYDVASRSFPSLVRIETTNACNAKCIICPHKDLQRKIRQIDDDLFIRAIDECAENRCPEVHLHNFGEPLLDRSLADRVRYAKSKEIAKVKIFTNGSLLTRQRGRALIDAGLDEIKISFDGATREEFERIRYPLKYNDVVRNVRSLVEERDKAGSALKIKVACCSTTDKAETMALLEGMVDEFSFGRIHNWGGTHEPATNGKIRKPCSRLWRTFTLLSSGEVALCCLDYDGQHILGRLDRGTSIREIFNGHAYRTVRMLHRAGRQDEIDLCRNCTKAAL